MHCRELLQAKKSVLHVSERLSGLACDNQASAPGLTPVLDASQGSVPQPMRIAIALHEMQGRMAILLAGQYYQYWPSWQYLSMFSPETRQDSKECTQEAQDCCRLRAVCHHTPQGVPQLFLTLNCRERFLLEC